MLLPPPPPPLPPWVADVLQTLCRHPVILCSASLCNKGSRCFGRLPKFTKTPSMTFLHLPCVSFIWSSSVPTEELWPSLHTFRARGDMSGYTCKARQDSMKFILASILRRLCSAAQSCSFAFITSISAQVSSPTSVAHTHTHWLHWQVLGFGLSWLTNLLHKELVMEKRPNKHIHLNWDTIEACCWFKIICTCFKAL